MAAGVDALEDAGDRAGRGRVVAIGHSAGGQLAVWAAARPGPRTARGAAPRVRVTAAVAQAAALDLHARLRGSDAVVHELLGGTPDERPDRYVCASPVWRLPVGVPVPRGGPRRARQEDVPVRVGRAFAATARDAGTKLDWS